ncbi:MAG: DUF4097 domain-containing protein [Lachnospiraceae bacterium]|nr:DUF4097 domain-containing protein [Lachnospiraceae bacterium]
MRKKVQIGLCLVLVAVVLGGIFSIWHRQKAEIAKKETKTSQKEETGDWSEKYGIDWDAYFDEGGYFGDFGEESINYPAEDVKGIYIMAEYATVHVKHSDEVDDVEVFTQVGNEYDAISCEMKDGILNLMQINLDEDASSDASYIEVTLPDGMKLDSFHVMQRAGATSLDMDGKIHKVSLNIDAGSIMAERINADSISLDMNVASVTVKNVDVKDSLKIYNVDGVANFTMEKNVGNYDYKVKKNDGKIRLNGDDISEYTETEKGKVTLNLETVEGDIILKTLE